MAEYLLVETWGPWHGPGGTRFLSDALTLLGAGHRVRLLLMEDGVVAALAEPAPPLANLIASGAQVLVDEFGLAQRGMLASDLAEGVARVDFHEVAPVVLDPGIRVVWH